MKCYGYLFGKIKLIKDTHHDEVFIEKTGLVVLENNRWKYDYHQLLAIAKEMLGEEING
jgi:hypothetical protein